MSNLERPILLSYVRLFLIISSCFLFANLLISLYSHSRFDLSSSPAFPLEVGILWGFNTTVGISFVPITGLNYLLNSLGRIDSSIDYIFIVIGNAGFAFANLITFFGLARARKWAWTTTLCIMAFNLVFASYVMIVQRYLLSWGPEFSFGMSPILRYGIFFQSSILICVSAAILYVMFKNNIRKYFSVSR